MKKVNYTFSSASTAFYFAGGVSLLRELADPVSTIIITDENVYNAHSKRFKKWRTIVLPPGEQHKQQHTADYVINRLIEMEADRKTTLVGIGGGVITDITGYVASVYMRGLKFGFLPTSLLALVDASIGGKNGVDVGVYKNLVGTIRQPSFILHDMVFLRSLPDQEWINGFAEIIKHACIRDAAMFRELESTTLNHFRKKQTAICELVRRNAQIKARVVKADEFEKGERRLLNFGHTLGHALENQYDLTHGQAVAIGMHFATQLSAKITGFRETTRVKDLLTRYQLPVSIRFDVDKVFDILKMDKKRERAEMNYVLLDKIGKGTVKPIPLSAIREALHDPQLYNKKR